MKELHGKITKKELKQNEIYKRKKKLDKIASKLDQKLKERRESERLKYEALKQDGIARISMRYDRNLEKQLKKIDSFYDRKWKNGKRVVYKKPIIIKESKKKRK